MHEVKAATPMPTRSTQPPAPRSPRGAAVKDELIMFVRRKRALPRTDTVQVSKEALDLLKRTSVAFQHLPPATKAADTELTSTLPKANSWALARRYLKGS